MSLITNKRIIAVLLIPIILIAFATPCFATEVLPATNIDFSAIAQKVLQIAMKVGTYSLQVGVQFAGQFMGIHDIGDLITMGSGLFTTGMGLVEPLMKILTQINIQDPASILPVLPQLLKFGIGAVGQFTGVLFGQNLTQPENLFNFAGRLLSFAGDALTGLLGVLTNGEDASFDLGSLGALLGSTDELPENPGTTDTEGPDVGVAGAVTDLGNPLYSMFDTFIGIVEDSEIIDLFFGTDNGNGDNDSGDVKDFADTNPEEENKNKNENTEASKPNIFDNTDENDGPAIVGGTKYALPLTEINKVISAISANKITQDQAKIDNLSGASTCCYKIAVYHISMLVGNITNPSLQKAMNGTGVESETSRTDGTVQKLKTYIDSGKPCIVKVLHKWNPTNVQSSVHYVTCVGYKGNGTNFSDFIFISSARGNLINGNEYIQVSRQGNSWQANEASGFYNFNGTTAPAAIRTFN